MEDASNTFWNHELDRERFVSRTTLRQEILREWLIADLRNFPPYSYAKRFRLFVVDFFDLATETLIIHAAASKLCFAPFACLEERFDAWLWQGLRTGGFGFGRLVVGL